uniref:CCHC-type domain-containing protein n=1 Tax=Glossina pallidipes TaxID=7398 RepID=A0A1A9ZQU6_GLOPL
MIAEVNQTPQDVRLIVQQYDSISLRNEELSEICGTLDLDTKGTVEEMRKAVTALITTPDLAADMKMKLTELETKYAAKTLHLPEGTGRSASPRRYAQEQMSCGAAMDRICKWSVRYDGESCALGRREYQLYFGDTTNKDLNEMIALGERFEDIPASTLTPSPRITSGPHHTTQVNQPTTTHTSSANRNACLRCGQLGHLARNCVSQRAPSCWDCRRPGVLTKNCCRRNAEQPQARGMTTYEAVEREERPSETSPAVVKLIGSTLVADLSLGGLPTIGVVDTGATRSIIREDITGFISFIKGNDTRSYTIRMADGSVQASKNSITVEVNIGDMVLDLELLGVKRCVDHLTLGMDFLSKTSAELSVAGCPVKLGSRKSTSTTTAAAKNHQAIDATETPLTPDPEAISAVKQTQIKE